MGLALVKSSPRSGFDPKDYDRNHLINFLMGADIRIVKPENSREVT